MISVQRLGTLELEREFNKPQRDCNQSLRHVYRERLRPACYPSKSNGMIVLFDSQDCQPGISSQREPGHFHLAKGSCNFQWEILNVHGKLSKGHQARGNRGLDLYVMMGLTLNLGQDIHGSHGLCCSWFWPWCHIRSFPQTLRFSNGSALCRMKMALPSQR